MKWEYLVVDYFPDIYVGGLGAVKSGLNHKVIENGRKQIILNAEFPELQVREHGDRKYGFAELPQFADYLNDLGSKGWELVATDEPGRKYVFKRPAEA